jgi:uracil-DNA glycosylase family 4
MLILVNPTYRNLSSNPEYRGARFPFIGVRQFWKVLADGGLIDKKVAYGLPLRKNWRDKHTELIKQELIRNKLFLTNIVKCCYGHSLYPDSKVIDSQLKFLAEEINIVNPKKIVAFGALVYKTLTGKNIKLAEYWNEWKIGNDSEIVFGLKISVMPCYFPIGRGNPKKAAEILRKFLRTQK